MKKITIFLFDCLFIIAFLFFVVLEPLCLCLKPQYYVMTKSEYLNTLKKTANDDEEAARKLWLHFLFVESTHKDMYWNIYMIKQRHKNEKN